MRRTTRLFAVFFLVFSGIGTAQADDFATTCRYFNAVAFNDVHTRVERTFRSELASDCQDALGTLRWPNSPVAAAQARSYLIALQAYRALLLDMATSRYDPNAQRLGSAQGQALGRPITRAGEILIARVMGLTEQRSSWVAWKDARAR